jgi:RNA polymerase sigma-70 factor, ECF subfamily
MSDMDQFKSDLLETLPHLRAFARMLARDHTLAEDLVQDTVVQALANREQFRPGTNLRGWLIIILRNRFYNELRRSSRKSEISVEHLSDVAAIDGGQEIGVEVRDFQRAFRQLPAAQREALTLVGASGFSYQEAAEIAGCPIGTLKSRVSRARLDLQRALNGTIQSSRAIHTERSAAGAKTSGTKPASRSESEPSDIEWESRRSREF